MIAVFQACALSFLRDRAGMVMTLLLPPLVYLLFASVFGAGAKGEIDPSIALHDMAPTLPSRGIEAELRARLGSRLTVLSNPSAVETAVVEGRSDAGLILRPGTGTSPEVEILSAAGREVAAAALEGQVRAINAGAIQPNGDFASRRLSVRSVGPQGDLQSVYYAGAVSIMFVFFAAMHGAMTGLDDRRSGLQARLSLVAGGLAPILAGRAAWLVAVGLAQSLAILAAAASRLPPTAAWQILAWAVTALLASVAAAGVALAVISLCRSRDQAQPLSTFIVLLLAAVGGSMAPRFLMPDLIRQIGWFTPHAWAIEAYQTVLWRGVLDVTVLGSWCILTTVGLVGGLIALAVETRRAPA